MRPTGDPTDNDLLRLIKGNPGLVAVVVLGTVTAAVYFLGRRGDTTRAVHALIRAGAHVEEVGGASGRALYDVDLSGAALGDREMGLLERLGAVSHLRLSGASITDEDLARLSRLTSLADLTLTDTQVTDEGLPALRKLPA